MKGAEIKGTDELAQFTRPPFIKIVQGASDANLKEEFGEGAVLAVPGNDLLLSLGDTMYFTPLYFYREFLVVNPLELRGQVDMVHDRSFDPQSEIAKRAFDKNLRNEQLFNPDGSAILVKGKPIYRSYQDTRVFLIKIWGPTDPGQVCAMVFARGELRTADRLSSLISARQASLFYCVFAASVSTHYDKAKTNDWKGFDIDNPEGMPPFVDAETASQHEKMHDILEKAVRERKLQVDAAPAEGAAAAAVATTAADPNGVVEEGAAF